MAHPAPALLIPTAAREAHDALVAALGTENNPSQWMLFMKAVTTHLPDVLSSGRPSAADIRNSVIGLYGFKSWRQMIEADIGDGGFGWNYSTWKAWRRAWSVVDAMPWLRDERVTYSEVIQLSLKIKKANLEQPPQNMAEAQAIAKEIKANSASIDVRESNLNSDSSRLEYDRVARARTARRIRDLRNKRHSLTKQLHVLGDRTHQLEQDLTAQSTKFADRESSLSAALTRAKAQRDMARELVRGYQALTFWQRVRAVWQGL